MKIQIRPSAKAAGSKSPTTASRKALQGKGQAMPGGRYPIPNVDFLKRAIRSIGRTPPEKRPAVVAWIKKRAAALGQSQLAANLSNAADYALELAGNPASSGEIVQRKYASGAAKKPVQSKLKGKGLKTNDGKLCYAKLRAQGYDKKLALNAAMRQEQGLMIGEWSNSEHLDGTLEFAFPVKGGSKDVEPDADDKQTPADKAKGKLGLKHPDALKTYAKARKRGLPHNVAMQGAKMVDKKRAAELSNNPKA